jgi:hypothetical protein
MDVEGKSLQYKRSVLPQQLQNAEEALIEKYVTLVHFIYRGTQAGKRLLSKAEQNLLTATNDKEREKAQKDVNFARKVLPKRSQLRYPDKDDPMLDQLELLGLIRSIAVKDNVQSRPVTRNSRKSFYHHSRNIIYSSRPNSYYIFEWP